MVTRPHDYSGGVGHCRRCGVSRRAGVYLACELPEEMETEPVTDAEVQAAYLAYNRPGDGWDRMRAALEAARRAVR